MKEKKKFGKFLEGEMSSDEEFTDPPKELAGIEVMMDILNESYDNIIPEIYRV